MTTPAIVTAQEWQDAWQRLLVGDEALGNTWSYLDMTALGRQESWEDSPPGYPQGPPYEWWRRHDEYDDATPTPAEGWRARR